MKNYKSFLLLIMLLNIVCFSQTQERIPWPTHANSPWPVGRGDAQATGRSEYVGPKTPNIIWKKSFPFGLLNSPVIGLNGNLLIGTRAWNSWDIFENYFYCADSAGNILWTYETDSFSANNSAPAVAADGTIYFGNQNWEFYSLDKDGNFKWKHKSSSSFYQTATVLDKEGNIYIGTSDSLFCFKPNGEIKFRISIGAIRGHVAFSPHGDILYVQTLKQSSNLFLYAIDLDEEIIWEKLFYRLTNATIMIDNYGYIYVKGAETANSGYALLCIKPDGNIKWQYKVANLGFVGAPTIDKDGNIIFRSVIKEEDQYYYGITSLDYEGNFRWFYNMEETGPPYYMPEEIQHGLVCDADGTIYAGSTWGYNFYAISKEGELLWKIPLDGMYADSSPVIGRDGTLYVGLHKGASENNLENTLIAIKDNPNSVENEEVPTEFVLQQNYPNPFNPSTTIKFSIPKVSEVQLSVYNTLGQKVALLLNETKHPGSYEVAFDGSGLSSGVYIYVLEAAELKISRKMLLIK
ncbi:hypothetical protein ASZ90_004489 [hydrocarbon metagenome]|uniref:Secretion system C-terminal sorting domain-containing protein n=1 Tax=hydrocarbon metagenome TaxID=938273 RepID=A0A0W8FXP1_9ZZZZ